MKKLIVAAAAIAFISTTAFVPSAPVHPVNHQSITDTIPGGQQDSSKTWNDTSNNQMNHNNMDTTSTPPSL